MIDLGDKYIHAERIFNTSHKPAYTINTKTDNPLGSVEYYYGWRQYVFVPVNNTEFNNSCLNTISGFLTQLNKGIFPSEPILTPSDTKRA
jgi:hypothetical protein